MRRVLLPRSGRETSSIGFGCAGLATLSDAAAGRLLGTALDNGITHFDVAPLYGSGRAEVLLGRFVHRTGGEVTVTTKIGLEPNRFAGTLPGRIAKRVLRSAAVGRRVAKGASTRMISRPTFELPLIERSLERSLRALRTGYIDILLLHEASLEEGLAPDLVGFLEERVRAGVIGQFGFGSDITLGETADSIAPHQVLQIAWDHPGPPAERVEPEGVLLITHGVLKNLSAFQKAISEGRLADGFGPGPSSRLADESTPALLLRAAVANNPRGIVLFATSNPDRISQNLSRMSDPVTDTFVQKVLGLSRAAHA